jgi:3-deoxy-7-phosphoheptulonate synthase
LLAIIGPCSLHDPDAALEYAQKLKKLASEIEDEMFVVMRTYFEKPRTVGGWKGLILDPKMDGSYDIGGGILAARSLLLDIVKLGLPVGCEVLDPIIPQYIDELMSWSSIGARTTESQIHRNLASGLSVAVGFKNSTSGDLNNAINAIKSALQPASFIGMDGEGASAIFRTTGNDCCHLILRGGDQSPNYYEDDVENARLFMQKEGVNPAIIIDCSHANSRKHYERQKRVLRSLIDQVSWGEKAIRGFMLESNLEQGCQKIPEDLSTLKYGVSVTDACIGWDETERIVHHACDLLRKARREGGVIQPL